MEARMDSPFDSDLMDDAGSADGFAPPAGEAPGFDTDSGDRFDALDALGDEGFGEAAQDGSGLGDSLDAAGEGEADDMAVWNAFEDEVADGLDAADDDEFIGRLLGGLGRAAGVVGRGMGQAARVAQAATPAAQAAARLARVLGAPGLARGLGQAGRIGHGVAGAARHAQGLFGQLTQLLGQSAGTGEAFDEASVLYLEDGVDEALPATARQVASNPRVVQQVARTRRRPAPLARPTNLGRGLPDGTLLGPRQFRFHGPVTLTITPH
jgi:hypothetical protein